MDDIEDKLDLLAAKLAELMLSQLGFKFIPEVSLVTYRLFTVIDGYESISFSLSKSLESYYQFEPLNSKARKELYEYQQFNCTC
jgi:hypothetical protein